MAPFFRLRFRASYRPFSLQLLTGSPHGTPNTLSELTLQRVNDPTASRWELQAVLKGGRLAAARPTSLTSGVQYQPAIAASPDESPEVITGNRPVPTPRYGLGLTLRQLLTGIDDPI